MSTQNSDPVNDGDVRTFYPQTPAYRTRPSFYYVNGIRTEPAGHTFIAELLANITESPMVGIYNATSGMLQDLRQCVGDWMNIVRSQVGEKGFWPDRLAQSAIDNLSSINVNVYFASDYLHSMREALLAPSSVDATAKAHQEMRKALKRNAAALSLYDELTSDLRREQIVIAHSQGNLITAFALWGLQAVYGSEGLARIQVRSISSPSPAWPRGINNQIKVYGQRDDPVTWFDPKNWTGNRSAGFWDNYFPKDPAAYVTSGGIAAHDAAYNINGTSLWRRLRADAGIAAF